MNCIQDISKTLVAMSNTNSEKECGLVIVGIANDKKAYDEWYKVFGEQPVIISQHYVPGVGCEAKKNLVVLMCIIERSEKKLVQNQLAQS